MTAGGISGRRRFAPGVAAAGLALALGLALTTGCSQDRRLMEEAVSNYILAVQQMDAPRLAALSAIRFETEPEGGGGELAEDSESSRRDLVGRRLQQRLEDYLRGRDAGQLRFEPDGLVLIRALNLGRGAYYETTSLRRPGPDRAVLIQEVRLAYRSIELSRLPRGTTIYLMGVPLGTVYHPVIGAGEAGVREILERIWLRWDLVREDGAWKVAGVAPAERPPVTFTDTTRF